MPFLSPIRATCTAHLILLDFITRRILGEQYRSLSSSLFRAKLRQLIIHNVIRLISINSEIWKVELSYVNKPYTRGIPYVAYAVPELAPARIVMSSFSSCSQRQSSSCSTSCMQVATKTIYLPSCTTFRGKI
jgi:hypothetical protein